MTEFMKDREAAIEERPAAVEAAGSVDSFSPEGQQAILALLVTLADNKYRLGRRYSEWATSAPTPCWTRRRGKAPWCPR